MSVEPTVWRPHYGTEGPPDPKRCPGSVHSGRVGFSQCLNPRGKGQKGWCHAHDPEAVAARDAKRAAVARERADAAQERRIRFALQDASTEQLEAELERRRSGGTAGKGKRT